MSGYNFSYRIYKKYIVDIFEYYEDTNFTRAFVYRKNSIGRDLIEIMDFPPETDMEEVLERAGDFIKALERLLSPARPRKKSPIAKMAAGAAEQANEKSREKSMDDL